MGPIGLLSSHEPTSPIDRLDVTATMPTKLVAGHTTKFTVTLHNPTGTAIALSPCPAYVEYLESSPLANSAIRNYYLNCDGANGTIPAHDSVTFNMDIPTSTVTGVARWGWHCTTPTSRRRKRRHPSAIVSTSRSNDAASDGRCLIAGAASRHRTGAIGVSQSERTRNRRAPSRVIVMDGGAHMTGRLGRFDRHSATTAIAAGCGSCACSRRTAWKSEPEPVRFGDSFCA